jgi:hypothetical protein
MSFSIVLAIGDTDKGQIGDKPDVALQGPNGGGVAILRWSVRFIYLAFPYLFRFLCVFMIKNCCHFGASLFHQIQCLLHFQAENGICSADIRGM